MASLAKAAFINNQAYASGNSAPMLDLTMGGQHGYHPNFAQLTNSTGYQPQDLIPLLVLPPRGFTFLPQREKWTAALKSLIEVQSKQITGLRSGITTESSDRAVGGGGHQIREAGKSTEAMSTPTHVWDVNYNKGISNFWERYKRLLINEPITRQPGVMSLGGTLPTDRLIDFYAFTTLYIEPDPTKQFALDAWLCVNSWPLTSGELEYQMDPTTGQPVPELSIEMACTPIRDDGIKAVAQDFLSKINYTNAGPMQRKAVVDTVDSSIKAVSKGYLEDIAAAVSGR
jgi:hypothetical protein